MRRYVPMAAILDFFYKKGLPNLYPTLLFIGHWPYPYLPKSVEISFLRFFSKID